MCSPCGHCRRLAFALLRRETHASTFLSSLPSERLCFPPLSRVSPLRYYGDSDSYAAHLQRRSPRLPRHTFLSFRLQPRELPGHRFTTTPARPAIFGLRHGIAGSPQLSAESSSFAYGPTVRLRLLSTPHRANAVTFGYGVVAYSDTDFHRANVAPSRAHSFPRTRESRFVAPN